MGQQLFFLAARLVAIVLLTAHVRLATYLPSRYVQRSHPISLCSEDIVQTLGILTNTKLQLQALYHPIRPLQPQDH